MRCNIEETPHNTYSFNYGEDILSFSVDRSTNLINPRPHTTTLPHKKLICIELSGPPSIQYMNPLDLELHNMFVLHFWKGQSTCGNKLGTDVKGKFRIRVLKNKFILELGKLSTLWLYLMKKWQPPPILFSLFREYQSALSHLIDT